MRPTSLNVPDTSGEASYVYSYSQGSGERPTGDTLAPLPHLKILSTSVSTGNSTFVTDVTDVDSRRGRRGHMSVTVIQLV